MQRNFKIVVTDASCFIILQKIGATAILNVLFNKVYTTPEVANEYGFPLPDWVIIKAANNIEKQNEFNSHLDSGESSAIALAIEVNCDYILIDDLEARKFAEKLGLQVKGSLGLLLIAKQNGVIPSIRPYLDLIQQTNFRISAKIINDILIAAGE